MLVQLGGWTRLVGVAEDGKHYTYVPQEGTADLLSWNMDDATYSYHSLGYSDASAVAWWPLLVGGLLVSMLGGGQAWRTLGQRGTASTGRPQMTSK